MVISVPPVSLDSDAGLTSWASRPLMSDSLFIFDSRDSLLDTMIANSINAAPSSGSCPTTTGFTSTSAEASAAVAFVLSDTLSATIPIGAPIRFYRRVRYSLYQATDGQWYLGYRDFVPGRSPQWTAVQPVAGPLMPYAASGATGLRFTYRDSLGTALTSIADAARVRSIEIVARAQSATVIRSSGSTRSSSGHYVDSLRTVVALRNY